MKKILLLLFLAYAQLSCAQTDSLSIEDFSVYFQETNKEIQQYWKNKNYNKVDSSLNDVLLKIKTVNKNGRDQLNGLISDFVYYNKACIYSLQNKRKEAVNAFRDAIKNGYTNYTHAKDDSDLKNIRSNKQFQELLASIREKRDYIYLLQQAGKYEKADTTQLPAFRYESVSDNRLKMVKQTFKLESVAGEGDEISQIINLMTWVHNTIRHDGSNNPYCEKDAIDLYNYAKANDRGINCRMLAIVLNECYLSMGFKSRFITCLPQNEKDQDCHVINCVYSQTLKKWLWMDPTFNAYLKDENGTLLSIREVRERIINNQPIVLNKDANWNNKNTQTKEHYIDNYMAKNLYWLQCPVNSFFNVESPYRKTDLKQYISLEPKGFDNKFESRISIRTNDDAYFWQAPE